MVQESRGYSGSPTKNRLADYLSMPQEQQESVKKTTGNFGKCFFFSSKNPVLMISVAKLL